MKILVLGRSGQLAGALERAAESRPHLQLRTAGRPELDLGTEGSAAALIKAERADLVVNTAAYTAVDKAEEEPDAAHRINAEAAEEAAAAANASGSDFVHISTDYVFDGKLDRPYRESDKTGPINVYGRSKLAGEELVRRAHPGAIILRTSWLYDSSGSNFVATMLRLAGQRDRLSVVADQRGCPTHVDDLAAAILHLSSRLSEARGQLLNAAATEPTHWADFARAIFRQSARLGGPHAEVTEVTTEQFGAPAPRPRNSVLDGALLRGRFGFSLPGYSERVAPTVEQLLAAQ